MLAFPSSDVEMSFSENAPSRNSEDHGHARVNSSPTRPSDICRWPSAEKRTPPRPRPHLRSLDLASSSPPTTPSYLSPAFPFAPKSAGIARTVPSRATVYAATLSESLSESLVALNLNPTSADELSDTKTANIDYVDLNSSPTPKHRTLTNTRSSSAHPFVNPESASKPAQATLPSLSASSHRREFFPRSPVRVQGQGLATPPLTPSSSFASADTTRSEGDEQSSDAEDRRPPAPWYNVRCSEKLRRAFQPVEYDEHDGAQVISFNAESHARYISGTHGLLRSDTATSPVRKATYSHLAPDSPTPVRGRVRTLQGAGTQDRSTSASSEDDYEKFVDSPKPLTSGLAPAFDNDSVAGADPFSYPNLSLSPPHPSSDYRHGTSTLFSGFTAYSHTPYDFPHPFPPAFGASPPMHIPQANPPSLAGHHAFDAAMAQAYASRVGGPGPTVYQAPLQFEPASTYPFAPSRTTSPLNRQFARSSALYTNRHNHKNGQHRRNVSARANGLGHSFPTSHSATPPPSVPDKNILNIDSIASGGDTRTTVMIKNIPNKMTDEDLLSFINRVSPRRIDFFYLRMDFTNGCNVGYAFVNFITPEDLLHFAKTQLGVKWNMYSSEKVLQLSYANYQGKEALVEKFRNSGIMDERPAWRPRIFYSSGHHQGMPQPFPQATHLRRKERSANNRGALFVPAPAALGPRQHHVPGPPPPYWGQPAFGYGGCSWVPPQ